MSSNQRVTPADVDAMMRRYGYPAETRQIIAEEKLLPTGLLSRLHATYPQHSGLLEEQQRWFAERGHYEGLDGFRQVVAILERHGIHLWGLTERELFIEVYRFRATHHVLNAINWDKCEGDSLYQLMMPQPGMVSPNCSSATWRPLPPRALPHRGRVHGPDQPSRRPPAAQQAVDGAGERRRSTSSRAASTSTRSAS